MITIKTPQEIKLMRESGHLLAKVVKEVSKKALSGISCAELNELAEKLILNYGAKPAFKGYGGYPYTLCTSVNSEVVHGFPTKEKILRSGDIVGLDCGLIYKGYYSDMTITVGVGEISPKVKRLVDITRNSLNLAIDKVKPGVHLGDISQTIQSYVEKNNYSVVRDLAGHGIGKKLHEDPEILNFGVAGQGPILKEGMTVCFEPMVNEGAPEVAVLDDGWTVVTADNSLSAHFEHTILVTKDGYEVLTQL